MTDTKCEKIRPLLSAYLDNELAPVIRTSVEKHLRECPECTALVEKMAALSQRGRELEFEPGEEYWEKQKNAIIARIEKEETEKIVEVPRVRRKYAFFRMAAIAASLVLITYISIREYRDAGYIKNLFRREAPRGIPVLPPKAAPSAIGQSQSAPPVETGSGKSAAEDVKSEAIPARTSGMEAKDTAVSHKDRRDDAMTSAGTEKLEIPPLDKTETAEVQLKERRNESMPGLSTEDREGSQLEETRVGAKKLQDAAEIKLDAVAEEKSLLAPEPSTVARISTPVDVEEENVAAAKDSADMLAYMEWRRKLEVAEARYNFGRTQKSREDIKGTVSAYKATSEPPMILELAEAYYQVGRLSPKRDEAESMLAQLRQLVDKAGFEHKVKIRQFILQLESHLK